MSYKTSPTDCNRYVKALIEAADHGNDLRDIHDQFDIPLKHATDYMKRVAYLLSTNSNDLEKVAEVLNHDIDYMDQISTDELRKFVRNQNHFNQVLELRDIIYEDEPTEKHNTEEEDNTDDNVSMVNNQPPTGHDNPDSHDTYDPNQQQRRYNNQNQNQNTKNRDQYVKKTRDELMRESASAEQYQIPQFKSRKELLKWVLDRISYLQKTKIDDFMLFFSSDEDYFMMNPDQLYILMFNHLGKHAADIAYERFKRMLGNLPPDQGFNNGGGYPSGMMGGMGMMQGMPGVMMPGMFGSMNGGKDGQQNNNQFQYGSNPQMYYIWKGVLPPTIPYNSPEGQMLIWEYEKEQAESKEREKKRQKFREDMQDQMDYKLQNFMDPDKLAMFGGGGGNNGGNAGQNAISQALIAAGTHTASYVTNPDGTTSVVAVPKQGNGQANSELASVSSVYNQLITTMQTINETIIKNLTKPDEYKNKLVDTAFTNLLGTMDPLAQVERTKALMESFQPPLASAGQNIRDVIDTANYMLQSKKLDYDAKFVDKQQDREDRRWQWEREQEQRSEQESKSNTINLIKTFSELLPNAIGPLLQILSLVKGGGGAGSLGGIGSLLGGMMGGGGGAGGNQQQPQAGIDMNEIMGMANNIMGQMGLGGAGGQMSQGPFGAPGGIYNPSQSTGGNIPNPYPGPVPVPPNNAPVDVSKFSPYFQQNVAHQAAFNPKFAAPPSETWATDFEANIPTWSPEQPQQQQQPPQQFMQQDEQVYQEFIPQQQQQQPMEEPKGPLQFSESDFEAKDVGELESYLQEVEDTKKSLFNAEQAVVNVLNRKKTHKAPVIERQSIPKPEKIIVEETIEIKEKESNSDSDMGDKKPSILSDIHKQADESVDSIL